MNIKMIKLLNQRDVIDDKIKSFQRECPHKDKTSIPKSDTGNWSISDDRWWYEVICNDCGKQWNIDQ